jgi:hypothetical protein
MGGGEVTKLADPAWGALSASRGTAAIDLGADECGM